MFLKLEILMSLIYSAKVTERTSQTVGLSVARSGCDGCMTGCSSTAEMLLPADIFNLASDITPGAAVEVKISGGDQLQLLTHSLILPLLGFVLGSSLAAGYESSDIVVLLGALVGFLIGIRICKGSGFEVIAAEKIFVFNENYLGKVIDDDEKDIQ
ncbi:MAG: positive regulator of sigma E activity [Candidatus Azotimanducaceae bacterium]|jgi:positive regulator of sigma E activity